ncbi:MAG TPA: hydrolase [Petrimonas sp.]|mgnify:CR=1 FL=1|uniref:glycoside hydrolase family 76 protein n=1 Tax=Petrimonas sp. TaxID=2023866 RepID=UPI00096131BA|nr:glycoside hydrolase family 76 protein [Petrimonas sp.]MEA5063925.1 glycoside hydrolase family 76 protein [Petrimonas sp.]OJV34698.1 MAG: hydrolase [Bacteroidia bacterium 43-41]HHV86050.1 hydrolase [Petrimonas sp.]
MKKYVFILMSGLLCFMHVTGSEIRFGNEISTRQELFLAEQNIIRALDLADDAVSAYFTGSEMAMARYYNPYTGKCSDEKGSIWMFTSAIEAVNAALRTIEIHKVNGNPVLYNKYFDRYIQLLQELYSNADYYLGTFHLTSYTQTAGWTVYGVHRSSVKGGAKVEGIENVYDDQMWLIRELLDSYKLTGNAYFLEKAEYLTAYVLDGWDCTIDTNGEEAGGITWGPGYVTKHACSNGPMVSPLVWLYEHYKGKDNAITYRYIDPTDKQARKEQELRKSEYYLTFAKKIYHWQKQHLLREDGVYDDMLGGCTPSKPQMETVAGKTYRKGIVCLDKVGPAISYNSGTMLSGAADLYRVTGEKEYYNDAVNLSDASFSYFAKKDAELPGYYTYDISGFGNWFNGVLLRGLIDIYPYYKDAAAYIDTFQRNLDYGYENFRYKGFLPVNLLTGWNQNPGDNQVEGMFSFAFAAEYALLSQYELKK